MNVIERFRPDPDGDTYGTLRPSDIVDLQGEEFFPRMIPKILNTRIKQIFLPNA
jgi:hypothetical protein